MSSVCEQILNKIETDIAGLRVANGYQLNYPNTMKGQVTIGDCNNFPTVSYDVGDETFISDIYEDNSADRCELDVNFTVILKSDKENLVAMREQCRSDLKNFIRQNNRSISGNNYLKLNEITYVQHWNITNIKTETDFSSGIASIDFSVKVIYTDFHNATNEAQNINA